MKRSRPRRRRTDRVRYYRAVLPALLIAWLLAGALASGCAERVLARREPAAATHTTPRLVDERFPAARAARPLPRTVRAIWVARFHYRYPDDVRTIIRNCAALGANTILWQVRGEGTVSYRSRLEPWSKEFSYRDPGFDPLAVAVDEAHRHELRIEAWMNVLPGWRGSSPPPIREQLYHQHPDWFLRDGAGRLQSAGDFYLLLNPCLPEVRAHLVALADELLANYALDGIHLDYVRYAWETTPKARQRYPRDARTLELYARQTGRHPDDDARAWDVWRANQLTRLVNEIRAALDRRRPGATLTAAVKPDPRDAYENYFQNAAGWLREGLLDAIMPMSYTKRADALERFIAAYRTAAPGGRIVPGLGVYLHDDAAATREQLRLCERWGGDYALFSYESLHATAADRPRGPSAETQSLRTARRELLQASLGR